MPGPDSGFDFRYAVMNTEVIVAPKKSIETFGNTIINYSLVSELMDDATRVRIREGRMQASKPQIIMPTSLAGFMTEGFGEEAREYLSWLREHEDDIRILQYGYSLKQEAFSEEIVAGPIDAVIDRVKKGVAGRSDPFSAVVKGVDSLWDVCLVRLFWVVTRASVEDNVRELAEHKLFEREDGIPVGIRQEIEGAFAAAKSNPSRVRELGVLLKRHGLFERYQDRFFALVRR
ncbi:MAG: hypothetical protein IKH04_08335 [Kiritimatiellae bacterium]|nr:hypothetical protein [Kiritimatiellia bacterium]